MAILGQCAWIHLGIFTLDLSTKFRNYFILLSEKKILTTCYSCRFTKKSFDSGNIIYNIKNPEIWENQWKKCTEKRYSKIRRTWWFGAGYIINSWYYYYDYYNVYQVVWWILKMWHKGKYSLIVSSIT